MECDSIMYAVQWNGFLFLNNTALYQVYAVLQFMSTIK